jgi:predicted PurR-regulated permease PerM
MKLFTWRKSRARSPVSDGARQTDVRMDAEELDALDALFAAPPWLRDLGVASWLLVGVGALLFGLVWLIGATATITMPVITAFIVAAVASPIVRWLHSKRVPRALGAAIVLLGLLAIGVLVLLLVLGGIVSQMDDISSTAGNAVDKIESWVKDSGVDSSGASTASDHAASGTSQTIGTLLTGVMDVVGGLTSIALGLSFALLSLFFLLKDGPSLRAWTERHLGVPEQVGRTITTDVITSLRGYFGGVTIVAAFNAVLVGLGALVLGVPLAGTIAVVSFVTAYVPYVGAFVAGAFAVIIALGSEGTRDAIIMLVIVLLANGLLQNILQPIAFGATLNLNPLVVLIATIGAGCLFGMIGLVLAAPLLSAAVHITHDLAKARADAEAGLRAADADPAPI